MKLYPLIACFMLIIAYKSLAQVDSTTRNNIIRQSQVDSMNRPDPNRQILIQGTRRNDSLPPADRRYDNRNKMPADSIDFNKIRRDTLNRR